MTAKIKMVNGKPLLRPRKNVLLMRVLVAAILAAAMLTLQGCPQSTSDSAPPPGRAGGEIVKPQGVKTGGGAGAPIAPK